jgi:hypothetical protein
MTVVWWQDRPRPAFHYQEWTPPQKHTIKKVWQKVGVYTVVRDGSKVYMIVKGGRVWLPSM